jgi:hypothetical protein
MRDPKVLMAPAKSRRWGFFLVFFMSRSADPLHDVRTAGLSEGRKPFQLMGLVDRRQACSMSLGATFVRMRQVGAEASWRR